MRTWKGSNKGKVGFVNGPLAVDRAIKAGVLSTDGNSENYLSFWPYSHSIRLKSGKQVNYFRNKFTPSEFLTH